MEGMSLNCNISTAEDTQEEVEQGWFIGSVLPNSGINMTSWETLYNCIFYFFCQYNV